MTELQPVSKGKEMWDMANALSRSTIIPKAFQGQAANCFVALDMANRMGASPMEIMQNIYVVHGTPGFSAKYAIAMANRSGVFKGPIHYEERGSGASLEVEAFAIVRETGQRVAFTASMAMAKAEKWDSNPKYKGPLAATMLRYRAATLLIRTTCPEVLLGMQTSDEVEDVRFAKATPVEPDGPIAQLNAIVEPKAPEPEPEITVEEPPPAKPTPPLETDEIPF